MSRPVSLPLLTLVVVALVLIASSAALAQPAPNPCPDGEVVDVTTGECVPANDVPGERRRGARRTGPRRPHDGGDLRFHLVALRLRCRLRSPGRAGRSQHQLYRRGQAGLHLHRHGQWPGRSPVPPCKPARVPAGGLDLELHARPADTGWRDGDRGHANRGVDERLGLLRDQQLLRRVAGGRTGDRRTTQ